MEEFRFLNASKDRTLPTFTRIRAHTRMDAIEEFAQRYDLRIRSVADETVSFRHDSRTVFFSVSGVDPFLRVLFG